ncbi:MAG: hypothetical protein WCH34_18725 [Bacteroidota bacterium]
MNEQRFYMVYMDGEGAPTHKHSTPELANKEAERLSLLFGKKTYVLKAVISIEPAPKTITTVLETPPVEDDLPF